MMLMLYKWKCNVEDMLMCMGLTGNVGIGLCGLSMEYLR